MWTRTTSSRDDWERLVAAVIKRDKIWQLCHQDSITTVDSDLRQRSLSPISVSPAPSPQLPLTRNSVVEEDNFGVEVFTLQEIRVATDNFRNMIGHGAFNMVYKGRLADGSLVAVKRLIEARTPPMILQELEISSIVAHRNITRLLGFCITKKERLLVYPYMPNGSIAQRLSRNYKSQAPLDWSIRPQIALGVARGLAHLHLECIRAVIHRDVTTSNILLDEDFQAVVAGFSLATFNDTDDGVVRGTNGYMAPECFTTGRSKTFKDDDDDMIFLSDCVTKIWEEKDSEGIVDPDIEGNFEKEEVEKLIEIALICMHTDPKKRPTMSEVVMMLENGHGFTESWEEYS